MKHEKYIQRCLQLAKNGLGTTGSNPMVGSVLVLKDKIIGEGWHYKAGKPHAEVNAIESVRDKKLLVNATIYVSLEPCSHFGKTPPCSDLIITSGIKKVIIGTIDPFSKVAGKGIEKLKKAGCEVIVGVLEKECQELNKRFFTFHTQKRPYIFLKWAETADGFIAPKYKEDKDNSGRAPVWISNAFSKQLVHKQRASEQAILIGTETAIKDDPSLNTRLWKGTSPLRFVLDLKGRIPKNSKLFTDEQQTIVITYKEEEDTPLIIYKKITTTANLAKIICNVLYQYQVQSIIIEGGKQILQTFIDANLWDEANVYCGDKVFFTTGIKAPVLLKKGSKIKNNKGNTITKYIND